MNKDTCWCKHGCTKLVWQHLVKQTKHLCLFCYGSFEGGNSDHGPSN